ncbi:MAG TPA: DUF5995 family protein [Nocardioidaceae bacterium]|nr:DUF5995 family protein [Nocardioidaceae bacterium]
MSCLGREHTLNAESLRHVRLLVGGIVTAVVMTLTGPFAAGTAHAGLLPYTPWSSYLPGWTDEYIPSSDNDCVSGKNSCLHGTLKELRRISDTTASTCSHDSIFALAYLRMTETYGRSRDIAGFYQDVPFANHQDAVFARYYTDAYYAYQNGDLSNVPQAWRYAFDAAKQKKVTSNGDLMLGMNAHINRDLPFVIAAVGTVAPDGSSRKLDFDRVEEWLDAATAPLMAEIAARFDPSMDDTADPLGLGYWTLFQLISGWRENAWRNAEALIMAPDAAARANVAAQIETSANTTAQGLLLSQAYTWPLNTTTSRDSFCSTHKNAAAPMAYPYA